MKGEWISAHIFYSGNHDLMLQELIAPFVKNNLHLLVEHSPWFFIRYWERGDHVRLRLHHIESFFLKEDLVHMAGDFFKCYPAQRNTQPDVDSDLFPDNSVQFINYIPEVERYGNTRSLPWAESYFASSSALILKWLADRKNKNTSFIDAIKLHLILLHAAWFNGIDVNGLCADFIDDWLIRLCNPLNNIPAQKQLWLQQFGRSFEPRKEQLTTAIFNFWMQISNKQLPEELYRFNELNLQIMLQYKNEGFPVNKILAIIGSLMHMTHNRLGINNREESYVMYCTHQCLLNIIPPIC